MIPWLIAALVLIFKRIALNSITIYSESESASLFVRFPRVKVTSLPLVNGLPPIALPGTVKMGVTLLLAPFTTSPAPEIVEDVMQLALPLHTKATLAVPSSTNCMPVGRLSINWTFMNNMPSGSSVDIR